MLPSCGSGDREIFKVLLLLLYTLPHPSPMIECTLCSSTAKFICKNHIVHRIVMAAFWRTFNHEGCSAQTQTRIGLLGKLPAVKQFPPPKANRRTRLLLDPRANVGMKRISILNLRLKQLRQKYWYILKCINKYCKYTQIFVYDHCCCPISAIILTTSNLKAILDFWRGY